MPDHGEYLSENSQRSYPFRSSTAGFIASVPKEFIVALRLFLSGYQEVAIFLSSVDYDSTADAYTLSFSDATGVLLTGTIERTCLSQSRVFKKTVLGSGQEVCVFTPGDLWADPSWGGAGSWSQSFTVDEAILESSAVLPGPAPLRRVLIDGDVDPRGGVWPLDISQTIQGGYNVGLSTDRDPAVFVNDGAIQIEAGPGFGLGYLPAEDVPLVIATVNGVSPDAKGNLVLNALDCLRISTPVSGGAPIDNTLQLESDCAPCCPCGSYRNMSAAISRRSDKVRDLCADLKATQDDAVLAYGLGLDYINSHIKNVIVDKVMVARDIMVGATSLIFSVQNRAAYDAYAYVSVSFPGTVPGTITVSSPSNATVLAPATSFGAALLVDFGNLEPLLSDGQGSLAFPSNISNEPGLVIRVGYPKQNGLLHPFPSGSSASVHLSLENDIRSPGKKVEIRTIGRFGENLFIGQKGHSVTATIAGIGNTSTLSIA